MRRIIGQSRITAILPVVFYTRWRRLRLPQSLKVPFAHDQTGSLVSVENAVPGQQYFCPACSSRLILRRGAIKKPHFAHKPNDICSQETIVHKTAKELVQRAIADWKAGEAATPTVQRKCQICEVTVIQALPDKVEAAALEMRLPDGFIADVALLVDNLPVAAIEILVTHAVGEEKATRLCVPFIEIDGYEVLKSPTVWTPMTDHFRPLTCPKCVQNFKRFEAKTAQLSRKTNIELPTEYYRYGFCPCWRCRKEILVFTWPGRKLHETKQPRKQPIPKTIHHKFSKTVGGKYWANVCPYCRALQGDWFLFLEPDGPFFGLHCEEDSPEAFRRDLMYVAHCASYHGVI